MSETLHALLCWGLMPLLALPLLWCIVALALHLLQYHAAWPRAIAQLRTHGLPADVLEAAIASLTRARDAERKTWVYDITAPIVMLIVLPFVPRSADRLPRLFRAWDNDVSLNGDSGGTLLADGTWLQWRDTPAHQWPQLIGRPQLPYDHPDYAGDAYYARGHHPRSFWARYLWIGLRNRASAQALAQGITTAEAPRVIAASAADASGWPTASRSVQGWYLLSDGHEYQYRAFTQKGPIVLIQNLGYKLEIARGRAGVQVAATAIGLAIKGKGSDRA